MGILKALEMFLGAGDKASLERDVGKILFIIFPSLYHAKPLRRGINSRYFSKVASSLHCTTIPFPLGFRNTEIISFRSSDFCLQFPFQFQLNASGKRSFFPFYILLTAIRAT